MKPLCNQRKNVLQVKIRKGIGIAIAISITEHFMPRCKEFRKLQADNRVTYLEENEICLRCLCKGHTPDVCRKTMITCLVCHGGHNSLTHIGTQRSNDQDNCTKKKNITISPGRNPQAASFISFSTGIKRCT